MPLARHDPVVQCSGTMLAWFLLTCLLRGMTISISAPRPTTMFLLTCLLRGMTYMSQFEYVIFLFLLTCLLRGMTYFAITHKATFSSFYSHASCEAWLPLPHITTIIVKFLLTCLLRGMTFVWNRDSLKIHVSTHMPLARHDFRFISVPIMLIVSTHMPLARHDNAIQGKKLST